MFRKKKKSRASRSFAQLRCLSYAKFRICRVNQLTLRWVKNVGTMGAKLVLVRSKRESCEKNSSQLRLHRIPFELKRRPCKYSMNYYPLYEGRTSNNYFLTKRCNHERFKKHFARPWGNEGSVYCLHAIVPHEHLA